MQNEACCMSSFLCITGFIPAFLSFSTNSKPFLFFICERCLWLELLSHRIKGHYPLDVIFFCYSAVNSAIKKCLPLKTDLVIGSNIHKGLYPRSVLKKGHYPNMYPNIQILMISLGQWSQCEYMWSFYRSLPYDCIHHLSLQALKWALRHSYHERNLIRISLQRKCIFKKLCVQCHLFFLFLKPYPNTHIAIVASILATRSRPDCPCFPAPYVFTSVSSLWQSGQMIIYRRSTFANVEMMRDCFDTFLPTAQIQCLCSIKNLHDLYLYFKIYAQRKQSIIFASQ